MVEKRHAAFSEEQSKKMQELKKLRKSKTAKISPWYRGGEMEIAVKQQSEIVASDKLIATSNIGSCLM